MPYPKGKPRPERSGRKKGTPNKKTVELQELLDQMGCDPRRTMALIALNELPCGVCRGTGRTKYKLPAGQHATDCFEQGNKVAAKHWPQGNRKCGCEGLGERVCESCYGTLYEHCNPELRHKSAAELLQYQLPKRKAIEHSGPEGGLIQQAHEIRFVE